MNARRYLKKAENDLEKCRYKDCQISCRKALYILFEQLYDIRYIEGESRFADISMSSREDKRKYKDKIDKEVFNPIDFIEIDHEKIKNELIEMGIEYIIYKNLMRKLTPSVYYYKEKNEWVVMEDLNYRIEYNRENAYYCYKNAVHMILEMQRYKNKEKWWKEEGSFKKITGLAANVYKKASKKSRIEHVLKNTLTYYLLIEFRIKGLDSDNYFYSVTGNESGKEIGLLEVSGYICEDDLSKELINKFNSSNG